MISGVPPTLVAMMTVLHRAASMTEVGRPSVWLGLTKISVLLRMAIDWSKLCWPRNVTRLDRLSLWLSIFKFSS